MSLIRKRKTTLSTIILAATLPVSFTAEALAPGSLDLGDDVRCYVTASTEPGDGSKKHPYNSLQAVEDDAACEVILVQPYDVDDAIANGTVLDGGIRLKPGQRLFGLGPDVSGPGALNAKRPYITNTHENHWADLQSTDPAAPFPDDLSAFGNLGVGVFAADDTEVGGVHIDSTYNAGIRLENVTNVTLRNLLLTHTVTSNLRAYPARGFPYDSAAIEISNRLTEPFCLPWPPYTPGCPPEDLAFVPSHGHPGARSEVEVRDVVIRDAVLGLSVSSARPPFPFPGDFELVVTVDGALIEDIAPRNPDSNPDLTVARAYAVGVAANAGASTDVLMNDVHIRNITTFGIQVAVEIVTAVDNSTTTAVMSASTIEDVAGDGISPFTLGGKVDLTLDDVLIRNISRFGILSQNIDVPGLAELPSEISLAIDRSTVRDTAVSLFSLNVPIFIRPGQTGGRQVISMSESTLRDSDLGVLAVWAAPGDGTKDLADADNFEINLGCVDDPACTGLELPSFGDNRIFGNNEDFVFDGLGCVTVWAQSNWFGADVAVNGAPVNVCTDPAVSPLDTSGILQMDPRPYEK